MIKILIQISMVSAALALRLPQARAYADEPRSSLARAMSLEEAQFLLKIVIKDIYPELSDYNITLEVFEGREDFLHAQIRPGSLFRSAVSREYVVGINSRLLNEPPSEAALRAIFTHELTHIRDYTERSGIGLAIFAAHYLLAPIQKYERQTDLVAMQKGQGPGLIEYRQWLYRHESGEALEAKRRNYYQPLEIEAWIRGRREASTSEEIRRNSGE